MGAVSGLFGSLPLPTTSRSDDRGDCKKAWDGSRVARLSPPPRARLMIRQTCIHSRVTVDQPSPSLICVCCSSSAEPENPMSRVSDASQSDADTQLSASLLPRRWGVDPRTWHASRAGKAPSPKAAAVHLPEHQHRCFCFVRESHCLSAAPHLHTRRHVQRWCSTW